MSLENRSINLGEKQGFSWTNKSMYFEVPEPTSLSEKLEHVQETAQDARDRIYPAYVRLLNGVSKAQLWAASHPREIALASMATSIALGAIHELSQPDIASALQDPVYPPCETIPGVTLQPDATHGIFGGVCENNDLPYVYYVDGSPAAQPVEVYPAATPVYTQPVENSSVVPTPIITPSASSAIPTPIITPPTNSTPDPGSTLDLIRCGLIAAGGFGAWVWKKRRDVYKRGVSDGLYLAEQLEAAKKRDPRVLKQVAKAQRDVIRGKKRWD